MLNIVYMMVQKCITIKEEHEKFIAETQLNLSRFVQKKLDERMEVANI